MKLTAAVKTAGELGQCLLLWRRNSELLGASHWCFSAKSDIETPVASAFSLKVSSANPLKVDGVARGASVDSRCLARRLEPDREPAFVDAIQPLGQE